MENQHRLISGYRELTPEEIALMNELKQLEAQVLAKLDAVAQIIKNDPHASVNPAEPARWLSIGRTDLQKGFMASIRAIARPQPTVVSKE